MSVQPPVLRLRAVSPTLARARKAAAPATDRFVRRRLGLIWGLLFFNVIEFNGSRPLLPIPSSVAQGLTQVSLVLALLLALSMNWRLFIRPNFFLTLFTVLCGTTMMMSVDQYFGVSSIFRAVRLIIFVVVLWLITPWWGRSDLLLCRIHCRAMLVVLSSVILGLVLAPSRAFAQGGGGRLGGVLWPIPPTQVAHYAAIFTGLTVVLWFSGMLTVRRSALFVVGGFTILILTHTRTALVGLLLGILIAGLSLFVSRKRVRRAFVVTSVVVLLGALSFAPFFSHWFTRGQSPQQIADLTGRSLVWSQVLAAPRTEVHVFLGYGMSDGTFNGLPIDSSWLSTYDYQGLVGDVIIGLALVLLLIKALLSPRGPGRAIALFLIFYCLVASYTETGLGDASSYLLDLSVAMAVLINTPRSVVSHARGMIRRRHSARAALPNGGHQPATAHIARWTTKAVRSYMLS